MARPQWSGLNDTGRTNFLQSLAAPIRGQWGPGGGGASPLLVLQRASDSCSAISGPSSNHRRSRSESRGERSPRSRSRGRSEERGRRRSRSHERRPPWEKGFWAYVPPTGQPTVYGPPVVASSPRAAPLLSPHVPTMVHPTAPTVVHTPVIYPSVSYVAPQTPARPGRIYTKESYSTPSRPKATVFISKPKLRKANVYLMTSDDEASSRR